MYYAAPASTSVIRWHENLGDGVFSSAPRVIVGGFEYNYTSFLGAADLDGDGDPDVVHGSDWDNTLAWFENRGNGSFLGRRVIATDIEADNAIDVGDLDGDGDVTSLPAHTITRRLCGTRTWIAASFPASGSS